MQLFPPEQHRLKHVSDLPEHRKQSGPRHEGTLWQSEIVLPRIFIPARCWHLSQRPRHLDCLDRTPAEAAVADFKSAIFREDDALQGHTITKRVLTNDGDTARDLEPLYLGAPEAALSDRLEHAPFSEHYAPEVAAAAEHVAPQPRKG